MAYQKREERLGEISPWGSPWLTRRRPLPSCLPSSSAEERSPHSWPECWQEPSITSSLPWTGLPRSLRYPRPPSQHDDVEALRIIRREITFLVYMAAGSAHKCLFFIMGVLHILRKEFGKHIYCKHKLLTTGCNRMSSMWISGSGMIT